MAAKKTKASAPATGPAWYELVLTAPSVTEEKLQTALLLTASEDNEWKGTALRVATSTLLPFLPA